MRAFVLLLVGLTSAVAAASPESGPRSTAIAVGRSQVVRHEHRPADQPPSIGPRRAPVTIELFFVPGVASSNTAYRNAIELQERHPRRIRLILRPLERQGHLQGPEAALEAHAQGRFFEFMDAAVANGRVLRKTEIEVIAQQIGLDLARIERAWRDERHRPVLEANERRRLRRRGRNYPELLLNGIPASRPVGAMDENELEEAYEAAYETATTLLAEGVPVEDLLDELDEQMPQPWVAINLGPVDDPDPTLPPPDEEPPLLRRPLDLSGLPGEGPIDARVPIVVLCNLRYHTCVRQVNNAIKTAERHPDDVRVIWHPWYDESVEDSDTLERIHRAALCAEQQSAGWRWIDQALSRTHRSHGRWSDPNSEIDEIADQAEVDTVRLERCMSSKDHDVVRRRVRRAREAGVSHGPAVIVGGRIYLGGLADVRILQALVEDELRPGLLERAVPTRPASPH